MLMGLMKGAMSDDGRDLSNDGNLEIGAWSTETYDSGTFQGSIDDIRLYDRALTASEVTALYLGDEIPDSGGDQGWEAPVGISLIDNTDNPLIAPVYLGTVLSSGNQMELSIDFPAYNQPVDIWVLLTLPDGRSYMPDLSDHMIDIATGRPLPVVAGASGVSTVRQVLEPFVVGSEGTPFDPWPSDGTWGVYWLVAPESGGDLIKAIDNGNYELGFYAMTLDLTLVDETVFIDSQVILHGNAPLTLQDVNVDIFLNRYATDANGNFKAEVMQNQRMDAYVMLPQRDEDPYPVVYMISTRLPEEGTMVISSEETAISLLMNLINNTLLTQSAPPAEIKEIIRTHGNAFIERFTTLHAQDPYLLRHDNLENIFDQTYIDAAEACKSALENGSVVKNRRSGQRDIFSWLDTASQLHVLPFSTQYDFSVYEDTTGMTGSWDYDDLFGKMTGEIQIENDTMLFANVRVIHPDAGDIYVDFPQGNLFNQAFHPNILGPQKGWHHLWWAGRKKVDVDFHSAKVELAVGGGALVRTGLSTFLSLLDAFIPDARKNAKQFFKLILDYGGLSAALDYFAKGDIENGLRKIRDDLCDTKLITDVVTAYLSQYYLQIAPDSVPQMMGKYITKFNGVLKKIPITKIGLAVDVSKLMDDYLTFPESKSISFDADFPLNIDDMAPTGVNKVSSATDLPKITLIGMGLNSVQFNGETYSPEIYLEADDNQGVERRISVVPEDIHPSEDGLSLWFTPPYEWLEVESDIVGPIYVNIIHHFVDNHGTDELIELELPCENHEERFKIDLISGLAVNDLSQREVYANKELIIYGSGFDSYYGDNRVFFIDRLGSVIEAEVDYGESTYLKVFVPETLAVGQLQLYVLLRNGNESNWFPDPLKNEGELTMLPRWVTADPEDGHSFDDTVNISLFQKEGHPIRYTITKEEGSPSEVMEYSGPISLTESSTIKAWAWVELDGVLYNSIEQLFNYTKEESDTPDPEIDTQYKYSLGITLTLTADLLTQRPDGEVSMAEGRKLRISLIIDRDHESAWNYLAGSEISITDEGTSLTALIDMPKNESNDPWFDPWYTLCADEYWREGSMLSFQGSGKGVAEIVGFSEYHYNLDFTVSVNTPIFCSNTNYYNYYGISYNFQVGNLCDQVSFSTGNFTYQSLSAWYDDYFEEGEAAHVTLSNPVCESGVVTVIKREME